jgi:hypothetical protein
LDFGRNEDDGAAGSSGNGNVDECATTADCPVVEPCAPPVCRSEGSGSRARLRCIATPKDCGDGNPCTTDTCEPASGLCINEPPRDEDGDGHVAEAPEDAGCGGGDCDDSDPAVHPFAIEICDSRDNDCDRAVDEDLEYTIVTRQPAPLLSLEHDRADRAGLVWNGQNYGVTYSTNLGFKQSYFKLITAFGQDASEPVEVSDINADAYAGTLAWSGINFFTAFSDARQGGGYEIYAARFRDDGVRVQSDVRLTDAPDFSLNPAVAWTGDDYVVAWDDRRNRAQGGGVFPQVYARRFTESGMPIGDEVLISEGGEAAENPTLAVGEQRLGFAYIVMGTDLLPRVRFRSFDRSLDAPTPAADVPGSLNANAQTIVSARDTFLIAWQFTFESSTPGAAIHMAAVDQVSGLISGGHAKTFGFTFARHPSLVSLGDRAVLLFAGAGADGKYEIWGNTVNTALDAPSAGLRLTLSDALSLFPHGARGPDGTIGIVFDEHDETPPNSRRPYFMTLGCAPVPE